MNGLIIEGVAGTGKSTVVSLLKKSPSLQKIKPNLKVIDEDQTTVELVAELRDTNLSYEDGYS
jgi:thymidylate kinase